MMQFTAKTFSSETEIYQSVKALRYLHAPAARKPVLQLVVVPEVDPPLWQTQEILFDHHIRTWKWYIASKVPDEYECYVRNRCLELRVDYDVIIRKTPSREYTAFRQIIWHELKTKFGLSYPKIARMMGARDHTTILSGVRRVERLLNSGEPEIIPAVKRLMEDRNLNDKIRQAYHRRRSFSDMQELFDIPASAISIVCKLEHWLMDSQVIKGPRCNMAALKRDFFSGAQIKWICQKYGISDGTFRRIRREYGWGRADDRMKPEAKI